MILLHLLILIHILFYLALKKIMKQESGLCELHFPCNNPYYLIYGSLRLQFTCVALWFFDTAADSLFIKKLKQEHNLHRRQQRL